MNSSNKNDYLFIILVVLVVTGIALYSSSRYQRLITEYPEQLTHLETTDFVLEHQAQPIQLGKSTGAEVQKIYPQGQTLGMSSVYRPSGEKVTFTFTKHSDVLTTVDITGPGLKTARGIAVNDPFTKVLDIYGPGYVKSYLKRDPQTYDAIYDSENYIVFHVKNGIVERIVLQSRVKDKKE